MRWRDVNAGQAVDGLDLRKVVTGQRNSGLKRRFGHPCRRIIETSADFLIVEATGPRSVGACALQKTGERRYELTKMVMSGSPRSISAGGVLLDGSIARARDPEA